MANESDTTYDWAQAIFEVMMSGFETGYHPRAPAR